MSLSMATEGKKRDLPSRISISLPHCRARGAKEGFSQEGASEVYKESVCVLCFSIKIKMAMFSLNMGPDLHSETATHSSAYHPYSQLASFPL